MGNWAAVPVIAPSAVRGGGAHVLFLAGVPLPGLVLLLAEAEVVVSVLEGVGVQLATVVAVAAQGHQVAVPPLGVGLQQLRRHLQRLTGPRHQPGWGGRQGAA